MKINKKRYYKVLNESRFLEFAYQQEFDLLHQSLSADDIKNIEFLIANDVHSYFRNYQKKTLLGKIKLNKKDYKLFLLLEHYVKIITSRLDHVSLE